MKTSPQDKHQPSNKALNSFAPSAQLLRARFAWLLLLTALLLAPVARAQVVGMLDTFTYSGNINGHAPDASGTGHWSTNCSSGSSITASGSQATIVVNSGTPGAGSAIGSMPFTPLPNTIYTLYAQLNYVKTTGTADCWAGFGFSKTLNGGNDSQNNAPWMLVRPQASAGASSGMNFWTGPADGQHYAGGGTVSSSLFPTLWVTIRWNTATGVSQYYLNNVLQATGTAGVPTGQYYAYIQGYQTGSAVNLQWIMLKAETNTTVKMQDNFDYTATDINGHAPTVTGGGLGAWATSNYSHSSIAATGSQANLIINSGTLGAESATASYAFVPIVNSFYTLRVTFNFNSYVGSTDCWAGFGMSTSYANANSSQNFGPWMLIRPQASSGAAGGANGFIGNQVKGGLTVPASYYTSGPVTATITWDTSTGEVKYYINNLYQSSWTTTTQVPGGQVYAFFNAFQTGNAVSVRNISLTAYPLPKPLVEFVPADFFATPPGQTPVPTDYMNLFDVPPYGSGTGSASWASARSQSGIFEVASCFLMYSTDTQMKQVLSYCKANNLKFAWQLGMLKQTGTCGAGEGYAPGLPYDIAYIANRIKTLGDQVGGVPLAYVSMDEPLYFGVYAPGTAQGGWGCQLSIATAAQQVLASASTIRTYFPNVQIGDLEPITGITFTPNNYANFQTDLQSWFTALQHINPDSNGVLNKPLAYFTNDWDWRFPLSDLTAKLVNVCNQNNVPYGMIFIGYLGWGEGINATSNLTGEENIQIYNASTLPVPSFMTTSAWGPNPYTVLPETSGTAMSYLTNYLFTSPYAVEPPPVGIRRYFSNTYGRHWYTSDPTEQANCVATGWIDESKDSYSTPGINSMCGIYNSPNGAVGLVPLYRYSRTGDHSHAFSRSTADNELTSASYVFEKLVGYVFPDNSVGGIPIYCVYNGEYLYTNSSAERNGWLQNSGWTDKGIKFYGMPRWAP